jgi:hypothetical protein
MDRSRSEGRCQGRGARYERSAAKRALILDSGPSGGYRRRGLIFWLRGISSSKLDKKRVQELVAVFSQGRPWFWSRLFRRRRFSLQPGPPAPRPALEDMAMVQEAVQHGGDRRRVAE